MLQRVAAADAAALATFYDRWADRVHAVAFWILNDADDAEDVVEETFWQVWRGAAGYDGRRAACSTWLLMIARSRALDRLRTRQRRAEWTASSSTQLTLRERATTGHFDPPDIGLERTDTEGALEALMQALPAEQRTALELAYFEGLSHREIASRTGQPLGTVKTRLRMALQKLRAAFDRGRGERP